VRFLLTNLATRRLGGFGFAKTFGTDPIIHTPELLFCNIEADVAKTVKLLSVAVHNFARNHVVVSGLISKENHPLELYTTSILTLDCEGN